MNLPCRTVGIIFAFSATSHGTRPATTISRAGWTVGGGLEYAVTNNWSVRAEYRYSDFGRYIDSFASVMLPAVFQVTSGHHLTENVVQVGFYKFDTWPPAPLVAKY